MDNSAETHRENNSSEMESVTSLDKAIYFITHPYVSLLARVGVGVVFLVAGATKILEPDKFAKSIIAYQLVPEAATNAMALWLSWLEVISGVLLILGVKIRANAVIQGGLLVVFIAGVFSAMNRGLSIDCGCFSSTGLGTMVGWKKIFENIGLLILIIITYYSPKSAFSLETFLPMARK